MANPTTHPTPTPRARPARKTHTQTPGQTRPLPPRTTTPTPTLYQHRAHPYQPRNPVERHQEERAQRAAKGRLAAFNEWIAANLTRGVGTMTAAYLFAILAILGFPFSAASNPERLVQWTSQTFIQLVMLSIIMVGNNVLSRQASLQSEEQYHAVIRLLHEFHELLEHMNKQDEEMLHQDAEMLHQDEEILSLIPVLKRIAVAVHADMDGLTDTPVAPPTQPTQPTQPNRSQPKQGVPYEYPRPQQSTQRRQRQRRP